MEMILVSGEKLKKIANSSTTAQVIVKSLGERERLRHTSDITRTKNSLVRSGERIVEKDYETFWSDLQAAGAGVVVYGRNGRQDRFKWHYSLKKIAAACLEGQDIRGEAKDTENKAGPKTILRKNESAVPVVKSQDDMVVFVPLRDGYDVEIKVPSNLTKSEVELLTRALARRAS